MKKIFVIGAALLFISGCGTEEAAVPSELCGYGEMMTVNGKEYLRINEEKPLTLDKEMGEITSKIDKALHPVADLTSNSLEEGTKIFSVRNHDDFLVAKTSNEKYLLFEQINY
ncbi:hypothetical protein D3H55_00055 [Bacillus salacetis]|uniref:Lipoprotein n=1 Tax=Bacillus salacetis TaxID=2315464 RepID=A0A3A1R6I7_9BACI|nr:hypothetical protein [Bacillus salacetis]RIW38791.1 hypothetical protein D3H55_00055 [Bacillus salacetis]